METLFRPVLAGRCMGFKWKLGGSVQDLIWNRNVMAAYMTVDFGESCSKNCVWFEIWKTVGKPWSYILEDTWLKIFCFNSRERMEVLKVRFWNKPHL